MAIKMKKYLALILALVMVFAVALTGCGTTEDTGDVTQGTDDQGDATGADDGEEETPEDEVTVMS